jgi:integrase
VAADAARAGEVLSLNVEDLDLEDKRARVVSKGGDVEWLHLQAGSARLLPRLIAGRSRGPLFLPDRRPEMGSRRRPRGCKRRTAGLL